MKIAPYLLLFVNVVSSEIVYEWLRVTENIGGELCKFRATSFEFTNRKFYLTLVDKDKKTPGVGYVAWFSPDEEPRPKLNIHGDKDDYRLLHKKGQIMAPMLVRADPCGDIWVMDANMYDISGEQKKKAPVFHIYDHLNGSHMFRDIQWNEKSVFMNIAFEEHHAVQDKSQKRCHPLAVYLADANNFNLPVYHYHEDTTRKYAHPVRIPSPYQELPNGYPRFLRGHKLRGIEGLTLVKTQKYGPLLLFHVLAGTTEYVIPLENRKNESTLHERDIRVLIEKGPSSEAGRTAYDPATGTLFFAEVRTRKIGFFNVHAALHGDILYRRFDIRLTSGVITDMKVIGRNLWVLTSSESRITLEKEIISEMIHQHRMKSSLPGANAVCEMLECNESIFPINNSNQLQSCSYLIIICILLIL